MTALLMAVLAASVMGSLHCAGMCGPYCAFAVGTAKTLREAIALNVAYHGGRLVTYALLGAIAGATGAMLDLASMLAGVGPVALAAAGGMMVLFGLMEIARESASLAPLVRRMRLPLPAGWVRLVASGQRWAMRRRPVPRAATVGLLTTLLPCGWLYAFVVTAAGAGSTPAGAAVMVAFWIGTLPVLIQLGAGVRLLAGAIGAKLPIVTSVALVLVGLTTLMGRVGVSPVALAVAVEASAGVAPADSGPAVPNASKTPPCCCHTSGGGAP